MKPFKKAKVLPIVTLGHPALREVASRVFNPRLALHQELMDGLLQTCKHGRGMGIAAPQVGESLRIIVVASKPNERYPNAPRMNPTIMVNPEIVARSPFLEKDWEGCLSLLGVRALVPRRTWIRISYQNRLGNRIVGRFEGFVARVIQHEIDHLNGVMFIDHACTQDMMSETEYLKLMERQTTILKLSKQNLPPK